MRRSARFLCLAAAFLAAPVAIASPSLLDQFARDVRGLEGRFDQRVVDASGRETERSSGRVAIAVPRQFRWEYVTPFPQLIVADGERVWIYDPDLEQVTVRRQSDEEQASPLAALIEPGALERQFHVEPLPPAEGLEWVRLRPRGEETAFVEAELGLDGDQLVEMRMTDTLRQRTMIRFSDWQKNPDFAPRTFRFVPEPGIDVVGDVDPGAEVYPLQD